MMTDEGEGPRKGRPGRKRGEPGKKGGKPGKKARKTGVPRRRKISRGRWRANLIFAIAHPVRRGIMRLYVEHDEPLSPAQIAKMLDLPTATIAYHVSVLKRLGALEAAVKPQAPGPIDQVYDSAVEDDPPIETLLDETKDVDEEDMEERRDG